MTTLNQASQQAICNGFTHIRASDGKTTNLVECTGNKTRASLQFVGGIGWILNIPAKRGYYELVKIANGYQARYNPLINRFVASHPEIGAGLAEFETLKDFEDYAKRG